MMKPGEQTRGAKRKDLKRALTSLGIWFLAGIFAFSACSFPLPGPAGTPTVNPDAVLTQQAIITQAAETIAAQLVGTFTQEAAQIPTETTEPPTLSPSPTPVFTPAAPASPTSPPTPAAMDTATPLPSTPTATAVTASLLRAEFATNCRLGPGTSYDIVAVLPKDAEVEVLGRDRSSVWWYIRNPEDNQSFCWVWSGTTEVQGDASRIEVQAVGTLAAATPGPQTPLAETVALFRISSLNIHNCGVPRMIFGVRNRSGQVFESVELLVEDLDSDRVLSGPESEDEPFLRSDRACGSGTDRLASGSLGYVGAWLERPSASGNRIRVTMQFCTRDGLGGSCFERVIEFIWP